MAAPAGKLYKRPVKLDKIAKEALELHEAEHKALQKEHKMPVKKEKI
jgi:hypothetical protein